MIDPQERVKMIELASSHLAQCIELLEMTVDGISQELFFRRMLIKPLSGLLKGNDLSLVTLFNSLAGENFKQKNDLEEFIAVQLHNRIFHKQ